MKIDKSDWKFVSTEPDEDFDAKHNQKVIDDVIKQNERVRREKERDRKRNMSERTHAIASYVKHVDKTKSNIDPEGYFGKRYLTKLRGQQIVERLQNAKKKEKSKKA